MPISPMWSQAAVQLRCRELAWKEKEFEEKQNEFRLKEKKMLSEHERLFKKLEMRHASPPPRPDFDLANRIKLVPPFNEKDV